MLYLLDASVLISAHAQYYAIDRVPEYWEWLRHVGAAGRVKIPIEIYEEIKDGPAADDPLFAWLGQDGCRADILLPDAIDPAAVQSVIVGGYAEDLTDDEVESMGRDPFLIAHGRAAADRCVVTVETSKPSRTRHRRKVPDVCGSLGVRCCDPFAFIRELGFATDWKARLAR